MRFWSTTVLSVLETVSTVVLIPLTVTDSVRLPTFSATSRRTSSFTRTTTPSTLTVESGQFDLDCIAADRQASQQVLPGLVGDGGELGARRSGGGIDRRARHYRAVAVTNHARQSAGRRLRLQATSARREQQRHKRHSSEFPDHWVSSFNGIPRAAPLSASHASARDGRNAERRTGPPVRERVEARNHETPGRGTCQSKFDTSVSFLKQEACD